MTRIFRILVPVLMMLLAVTASCIRENTDDCETPVKIHFLYFGDGAVDIFHDRISSVKLYVYGADGKLVRTALCSESELAANQGTDLRLPEGEYQIVCWGNAEDRSHVEAETQNPVIGETSWFDGTRCSGIDPLYFGQTTITVPRTLKPVRDTVIYNSSHHAIKVTMQGFANADNFTVASAGPDTKDAEPLVTLCHEGLSAYIGFDNSPAEEYTDYYPELVDDTDNEDSYVTVYRVPKFSNSTSSVLSIVRNDTGEELYRRPFADIMDVLGIDVESRDEIYVELRIRVWVMGSEVKIEITGWNTEIVFPGI